MSSDARTLLLAAPVGRTELPVDEALDDIVALGEGSFLDVVAKHPASSLAWALLAEGSLSARTTQGNLSAYAFARTGYHRGLDALRRAGWRGKGPIPWAHEPNQGFLRALWALASAAYRIGEQAEYERCVLFLLEASEEGYVELARTRPLAL
ncbi:DUF3151 domain-containing protein [Propioniciclava sinopodophylli]|uniref:DUF3151 domain-containing protein n=1 Tax=Propioniciclava sinopodophylli TaxID=1837344 RepID=A0A4Q9KI35_9ACTN|nr:DUF3151 domain-containing protein [Propioniciclava sinopodophylli]TBT88752.1 DUF3151 domain-containing protein [Propioniciclava sinopodophylli]